MAQKLRRLWLGLGCKAGTSSILIQYGFEAVCREYAVAETEIVGLATLGRKLTEIGLQEFVQMHPWPIQCLTAAKLKTCAVKTVSFRTERAIGIPSVAEAAALIAAGYLLDKATVVAGLIVPKQSFRLAPELGAVTLAIAQILEQ